MIEIRVNRVWSSPQYHLICRWPIFAGFNDLYVDKPHIDYYAYKFSINLFLLVVLGAAEYTLNAYIFWSIFVILTMRVTFNMKNVADVIINSLSDNHQRAPQNVKSRGSS